MPKPRELYGEHGSRYPIEPQQLWSVGRHVFVCADITDPELGETPAGSALRALAPTLIYVDPPWNAGLTSTFYSNVGLEKPEKTTFLRIHERIVELADGRDLWLEGTEHQPEVDEVAELLQGAAHYKLFEMTWARGRETGVVHYRGSEPPPANPSGLDSAEIPGYVLSRYARGTVLDPCVGSGTTPLHAADQGWSSLNIDLSPRRISQALSRLEDAGVGKPDRA